MRVRPKDESLPIVSTARRFGRHLTRRHAWVFIGLLCAFAGLTCLAVSMGIDADSKWRLIAWTTAGTLLGPFTGAISREWQSCCAENSWSLLPYAGAALGAGLFVQFLPLPSGRVWDWLRLCAWTFGWLAWFGSGILSLGHALE